MLMLEKRLLDELGIQIPRDILTEDLAESEAIPHELEPIGASVFYLIVLKARVLEHQPPVNKGPRVLSRDLAVRLALIVP